MNHLMHLIMTQTGLAFDVMCPEAMAITVEDIAPALALIYIRPGHTKRPLSVAEASMAVAETMKRDLGITDPAGLMAGLLCYAQRAYMPLLDPDHTDLWGSRLTGIHVSLRQALERRYALRTACAAYRTHIKQAATRVDASVMRDLSTTSILVMGCHTERAPEWLDFTQPHLAQVTPAQWAADFSQALANLELARSTGHINPHGDHDATRTN